MPKRGSWRTRFGFYLVAIGSACGLGNLWRFPYVVAENGGGAFVLLYLILALVVGMPLLIAELMIGKSTRKSILGITKQTTGQNQILFRWIARASVILTFVVLSYYAVISGWVLHFAVQFFAGLLKNTTIAPNEFLQNLLGNGLLQVLLASVHLLLAWLIVTKGVQEGLEKWIGNMMPLFVFLLLWLVFKSISLDTFTNSLRFLFYPDFSKLSYSSLISGLGHVFFTLSVGFGTMITFGSYLKESDHIPLAGFRVTLADTFISLLAGLLVFPILLHQSQGRFADPTLLFEALPRLLTQSRIGNLFGLLFFICLYIAALGASIGLFEVIVSNIVDRKKNISRETAAKWTGFGVLIFSTLPAFSSNFLRLVQFNGRGILEILDVFLISWTLPMVALGMSLGLSKVLDKKVMEEEFLGADKVNSAALYGHWKLALKYVIPGIIILGFVLEVIGFLL